MKKLITTIFAGLLYISMSAQVGVNNPNPQQALDVSGKVKITNDATAPTAGTMRYDESSNDFEGYNGTQWSSFTQSRSSGLPSNPIPIYGFSVSPTSNSSTSSMTFNTWAGSSSFSQVPAGKYLIITSVRLETNSDILDSNIYRINIGPAASNTNSPFYSTGALVLTGKGNINNIDTESGQSPIFILTPQQYLNYQNSTPTSIFITVRGFLVDDLNY